MTALIELYGAPTHRDLVAWIAKEYGLGLAKQGLNKHVHRREEIARRVRLYRDDADADFEAVIRLIFEDGQVQQDRIKLIAVAKERNVTGRIINEVGSLYDKPALRTLANKAEDARFHLEEKRLKLHEVMQETHRLLQLCNEVLVWQFLGVDGKPKLRIVTPDTFDALPDPRDKNEMAGVIINVEPISILPNREMLPYFEIWDDTFRYQLNSAGQLIDEPVPHELGRIPGVLLHKREPIDRLMDERPGRDITSAHLGDALLAVMTMRLSKAQGERQPILKGPLANVAKNQRMDGESPIALPPEVEALMLDTKTDPDHYILVRKERLSACAATYGLSYEQLANQETSDTASGKVYQLRREKLIELRGEQRRRALVNETEIVKLLGFETEGMKVDHQEQAIPQDAVEEVDLLEKKMKLGLDNPVAYLQRKDPDLDENAATALLLKNLSVWAKLVVLQRSLNMPGDANAANPGQSPQENGAQNGEQNAEQMQERRDTGDPVYESRLAS